MFYVFLYLLAFLIYPNNANAYIDPGGIAAVFNIILAGIATSIFYLRSYFLDFLRKVKLFFKDIKIFFKFSSNKNIVIYLENLQYKKYFGFVIDYLEKSNLKVTLLSDMLDDDLIKLKNIQTHEIKSDFLRNLLLNNINCSILILTTPDIGNLHVKKSKFCKCYFYIFHSAVSTQMVYAKNAFKNYDIICCNGDYQFKELSELNVKLNNSQKLLQTGYPYFDILIDEKKTKNTINSKIETIFIAPSWNPNDRNQYEDYYSNLVDELLKDNYTIIFRPHPEHIKRYPLNFENFKRPFLSNLNFKIDNSISLNDSFQNSDILITDWSGISFEYNMATSKPVIFYDIPIKKLNSAKINIDEIFEYRSRKDIGLVLKSKEEIKEALKKVIFEKKNENFYLENFYNLGRSSKIIFETIKSLNVKIN